MLLQVSKQDSMGSSSTTSKTIKNNAIIICSNVQYSLNQSSWLWSIKGTFTSKDFFQFFFGFVCMTYFVKRPIVCGYFPFNFSNISFLRIPPRPPFVKKYFGQGPLL